MKLLALWCIVACCLLLLSTVAEAREKPAKVSKEAAAARRSARLARTRAKRTARGQPAPEPEPMPTGHEFQLQQQEDKAEITLKSEELVDEEDEVPQELVIRANTPRVAKELSRRAKRQERRRQRRRHHHRNDDRRDRPTPKIKDPPAKPEVKPPEHQFVVIHEDGTWIETLASLIDEQNVVNKGQGAIPGVGGVWLYSDVPRWNPKHIEDLWNFGCGRTRGQWPSCGAEYEVGPDPRDPASVKAHGGKHKRVFFGKLHRPKKARETMRPVAVGFGLDAHILENDPRATKTLIEKGARAIIMTPGSPTRAALRLVAQGHVPPTGHGFPGKEAAMARSLAGSDGSVAARHATGRHKAYCTVEDAGRIMAHIIRRVERSKERLDQMAHALREGGVQVLELDADKVVDQPLMALSAVHGFVLGRKHAQSGLELSDAVLADVTKFKLQRDVLLDCKLALESAKIRFAVGNSAPNLVADVDHMLLRVAAAENNKPFHPRPQREHLQTPDTKDDSKSLGEDLDQESLKQLEELVIQEHKWGVEPEPTDGSMEVDQEPEKATNSEYAGMTLEEVALKQRRERMRRAKQRKVAERRARAGLKHARKRKRHQQWKQNQARGIPDYGPWEP